MRELPGIGEIEENPVLPYRMIEDKKDPEELSSDETDEILSDEDYKTPEENKEENEKILLDIDKKFNLNEIKILQNYGFNKPSYSLNEDNEKLGARIDVVKDNIKSLRGTIAGKSKKKEKTPKDEDFIEEKKKEQEILMKYSTAIEHLIEAKKYQTGQGIFFYNSPQELLKRFELLGGSLAAGNNGVLHEYIQIAHRLKDLGVVTNKQLNKLLRNYINKIK